MTTTLTNSAANAMQQLQAQWYNTLLAGLGLDGNHFMLIQPNQPLGATSDLLWSYFNDIPPKGLVHSMQTGGGNRFYDDYRAVVSQLISQSDGAFRRILGDVYDTWMKYVGGLNPIPALKDLPDVFRSWAMVYHPDIAQPGANQLASALNDPIFSAQVAVADQSKFKNGVPNFSKTIDDLRTAIPQAPGSSLSFDSSTASSKVDQTWAKGEIGGVFDFFSGSGGANFSSLSAQASASRVTVAVKFDNVLSISADPGSWYSSAALSAAYNTKDNTLWKHGTPSWDSTFGPNGDMLRFVNSVIVADGIDITITSFASYSSTEQQAITTSAKVGIWPFFSAGASGGSSQHVQFDSNGNMVVKITSPKGNPVVIGANVTDVHDFLGGA